MRILNNETRSHLDLIFLNLELYKAGKNLQEVVELIKDLEELDRFCVNLLDTAESQNLLSLRVGSLVLSDAELQEMCDKESSKLDSALPTDELRVPISTLKMAVLGRDVESEMRKIAGHERVDVFVQYWKGIACPMGLEEAFSRWLAGEPVIEAMDFENRLRLREDCMQVFKVLCEDVLTEGVVTFCVKEIFKRFGQGCSLSENLKFVEDLVSECNQYQVNVTDRSVINFALAQCYEG